MKERLSELQWILLMFWAVMAPGIIFLPHLMAQFVTRDAWLSAILFLALPVLLAAIAHVFVRVFPDQSLVQSLVISWGPWAGRLLSVWFLVWLFISTVMFLRKSTLFLEESVLPHTPLYVLALLIIVPVAYSVYMGIEVMGRMAQVVTPAALLVTVGIILLALRSAHWTNVQPILSDGWTPVLRGSVVTWRDALDLLLALQFPRVLRNPASTLARNMLIIGGALSLLGVLAELLITGVLGNQVVFNKYPIMEVVKIIAYGGFFQRLDPLYVMGVIMVLVIQLSVFQYAWVTGLSELIGLNSYQGMVWSSASAMWAASLLFWKNGVVLDEFMVHTTPGYFLLVIPLLALLAVTAQWIRTRWTARPANSA